MEKTNKTITYPKLYNLCLIYVLAKNISAAKTSRILCNTKNSTKKLAYIP